MSGMLLCELNSRPVQRATSLGSSQLRTALPAATRCALVALPHRSCPAPRACVTCAWSHTATGSPLLHTHAATHIEDAPACIISLHELHTTNMLRHARQLPCTRCPDVHAALSGWLLSSITLVAKQALLCRLLWMNLPSTGEGLIWSRHAVIAAAAAAAAAVQSVVRV